MLINGKEFITVREMAEILGIKPTAVKERLFTIGEKPVSKDALYSIESFEKIRNVKPKGRPRKGKIGRAHV